MDAEEEQDMVNNNGAAAREVEKGVAGEAIDDLRCRGRHPDRLPFPRATDHAGATPSSPRACMSCHLASDEQHPLTYIQTYHTIFCYSVAYH